jgi:hypothetical protein
VIGLRGHLAAAALTVATVWLLFAAYWVVMPR